MDERPAPEPAPREEDGMLAALAQALRERRVNVSKQSALNRRDSSHWDSSDSDSDSDCE